MHVHGSACPKTASYLQFQHCGNRWPSPSQQGLSPLNTHPHTGAHTEVNKCANDSTNALNPPPAALRSYTRRLYYKTNTDNCLCHSIIHLPPTSTLPPLTLPHSSGCGRGSPCQPCAAPLPFPSPAFAPGPPSRTPAGRAAPRPTRSDTDTVRHREGG